MKAFGLAAAAAIAFAPFTVGAPPVHAKPLEDAGIANAPLTPYPQDPSPGQQCFNWHATTVGPNGQMMTCTHLPDSGHLMYWEYGGPRDT